MGTVLAELRRPETRRQHGKHKRNAERRGRHRRQRQFRWLRRLLLVGFIIGVLAVVAGAVGFYLLSKIPLPQAQPLAQTSFIYAADGSLLAELHAEENRILIPFEADDYDYADLPDHLIAAVVAREDRRFFDHNGIDVFGIARAAWNDVRGAPVQGASTIPQQYAKNVFLSSERSLVRKLKEATIAIKLSRKYSKDEIMSMYLNTIYFGRGAYGVEAAAQEYFAKSARDLSVAESAFLAGIISAPERADPEENPDVARKRRDETIDAMVETGFLDRTLGEQEKTTVEAETGVSRAREVAAQAQQPHRAIADAGTMAHFTEYVRRELIEMHGEQAVYSGGLEVHTTIDPAIQASAVQAGADVLDRPDDPEVAIVTLDRDGRVRAMVGGRDFGASQVNLAVGSAGGGTGRQPGSTFKPIVYAAALDQGISPYTRYRAPGRIRLRTPGGGTWDVRNSAGSGVGTPSLFSALTGSVNTVFAQLILDVGVDDTLDVGVDDTLDVARELGIESELPPVPAVALGAAEVSPLEMAAVYNTFANRGERVGTSLIETVTDADGAVLYQNAPQRTRVLDEEDARNVSAALESVVRSGTGRAAQISGVPVAGKTGTTSGFGDAWFLGYTENYVSAVWIGYAEGAEHKLTNVHGRPVYGGGFPATIWQQHMQRVSDAGRM